MKHYLLICLMLTASAYSKVETLRGKISHEAKQWYLFNEGMGKGKLLLLTQQKPWFHEGLYVEVTGEINSCPKHHLCVHVSNIKPTVYSPLSEEARSRIRKLK